MKHAIRTIVLTNTLILFSFCLGYAQKISLGGGLGLGKAYHSPSDEYDNKYGGRIIAFLDLEYRISNRFSIATELSISGRLSTFPILGIGDYDQATNTQELIPLNMSANTILAKGYYYWHLDNLKPFIGLGVGLNTYKYKYPISSVQDVRKQNLAVQPEAGFLIQGVRLSARYIWGGQTPEFSGADELGTTQLLKSITTNALYLTASYQITFGEKSKRTTN